VKTCAGDSCGGRGGEGAGAGDGEGGSGLGGMGGDGGRLTVHTFLPKYWLHEN